MVDGGMDPLTAFAIATLMMLLNGGVLGLIHRDLPDALRPSAKSWRIGTLLMAAGCVLLAVQHALVHEVGAPQHIAVAFQQRVVQVEKGEPGFQGRHQG